MPSLRRAAVAAMLAAGVTGLAAAIGPAGPSLALITRTWSVTPGGPYSAAARPVTVRDTTTGNTLTCASAALSGTLEAGHGVGAGLGTIQQWAFTSCSGPLGPSFIFTFNRLPWPLTGVSYNAGTGVTTGTITGISISMSGTGCRAAIAGAEAGANGTVRFTYSNSTHVLKLASTGGDLHFWGVAGCFGIIRNGDSAALGGSYLVRPPQKITSP